MSTPTYRDAVRAMQRTEIPLIARTFGQSTIFTIILVWRPKQSLEFSVEVHSGAISSRNQYKTLEEAYEDWRR